jgi:FG-GAP-like repeat/FG-GAP repeat
MSADLLTVDFLHCWRTTMRCLTSSLLLCLLTAQSSRGEERFSPEVRVGAGGAPIDVAGFRGAAPCMGDFNGDGLNDLLVGQSELGRLRIYRNVGTRGEPRFDDFEWFRVNGQIAELPGGGMFRPQLVDLDGDGKLDIVTASESGMIFWYRRTGGDEFADAAVVRLADGKILNAGSNAACHVADWDGDGDHDLIIAGRGAPGATATEVWRVENRGLAPSLSLATPRPLEADGEPIRSPQREVYLFVADWNRDGKHDLLLGTSDGGVVLYENAGERRAPRLGQARLLVEPAPRGRGAPDAEVQSRSNGGSFCVTDWDNDGTLDILMGDALQVSIRPDASDTADQLEEVRREAADVLRNYRRLRGLNKKLQETQVKQREFVGQKREQYAKRLQELHDAISKLEMATQPRQESHGQVWLLRRMNAQ